MSDYHLSREEKHYSRTIDRVRALVEKFEDQDWTPTAFSAFLASLVEIINLAGDAPPGMIVD